MLFSNVSSHDGFLPVLSVANSTDEWLDFDVVVHAMVVENFLLMESTVWADGAFEPLLLDVRNFHMGLESIFVLELLLAHFASLLWHFMRQFNVGFEGYLIFQPGATNVANVVP